MLHARPQLTSYIDETSLAEKAYTLRHREYGWDVPATDIDIIEFAPDYLERRWIEYDNHEPLALIDMKSSVTFSTTLSCIKAQARLADRAGLPFFIAGHCSAVAEFRMVHGNDEARKIPLPRGPVSELVWVRFLYYLRKRPVPDGLLDELANNPVVSRPWYKELLRDYTLLKQKRNGEKK